MRGTDPRWKEDVQNVPEQVRTPAERQHPHLARTREVAACNPGTSSCKVEKC